MKEGRERETDRQTDRQTESKRERERQRQTETERDRDRQRQTDRQTQREFLIYTVCTYRVDKELFSFGSHNSPTSAKFNAFFKY